MVEGDGARILVVDDDASALDATQTMLEVSGYEVRGAQNGALGLEEVITFRPEVVVFDFWMPVADGRDLLQGIREVARGRIGLVAMSGTPEVEDWCGRVGVSQFVRKPFDRRALCSAVARALEEARTSSVRMRTSTSMPASRRLRVDRAVLVVGEREHVTPVRHLLREGPRPMQVAVVMYVEDAARALASFMLDAIAVLGASAVDDPSLPTLIDEARSRGLPVVLDRETNSAVDVDGKNVIVCPGRGARAMVDTIHHVVAGPRAIDGVR